MFYLTIVVVFSWDVSCFILVLFIFLCTLVFHAFIRPFCMYVFMFHFLLPPFVCFPDSFASHLCSINHIVSSVHRSRVVLLSTWVSPVCLVCRSPMYVLSPEFSLPLRFGLVSACLCCLPFGLLDFGLVFFVFLTISFIKALPASVSAFVSSPQGQSLAWRGICCWHVGGVIRAS